ncbi:FtsK/SpoIIIE domain-containing protein [Streptomyces sp. NPDC050535]|uniref:FtsK/SpoIIIE domain-containing protein n=1 Tax=Streptomyces sp. NPDC050535 TaxID=3365626 RepID=UPI00378C7976
MSDSVVQLFKDAEGVPVADTPPLVLVPAVPSSVPGVLREQSRWLHTVLHHARRYRYGWSAIRAGYLVASTPILGTSRMLRTGWAWMRADDYGSAIAESPEFVEKVRTRRRHTAWYLAGTAVLAFAGSWLFVTDSTPVFSATAVLGTGAVLDVRRRLGERKTPLNFPGLSRKNPGENAVTRAAVASKLGTGRDVEEMRLASPILNEGSGWSTKLKMPPGQRARKAIGKEADFASALGVGETQVFFDLVPSHAGLLDIFVAKDDPFLKVYPSPLIGRTEPLDFWGGIPVGVNGRAGVEFLRLVDASLLVAGEPRAGKTVATNTIVGAAALAVTPRIHLFDGKGAGDHRPWRRIAHTAVKREPAKLLGHLKRMTDEMERRFDLLDQAGAGTKLTPDLCRSLGVDIELTVVDETRYYVTSDLGDEIVAAMVDIASRGPAAGVILVLATQRMTVDAIPGPLKGVCSLRWAMRCPDTTASNAVLGPGAVGRGYDASAISRAHRGLGILDADGNEPTMLRSYLLDDDDLAGVAETAYRLREAAGTLPGVSPEDQVESELTRILAAFGTDDGLLFEELAARLSTSVDQLKKELNGVKVAQIWRDGGNAGRGWKRSEVQDAVGC